VSLIDRIQAKYPGVLDSCFDFSPPEGWELIVEKLVDDLMFVDPTLKIDQVKDKFGELRVYVTNASGADEAVSDLIAEAENASIKTCMRCGAPGSMREKNGWYYVACDEHAK